MKSNEPVNEMAQLAAILTAVTSYPLYLEPKMRKSGQLLVQTVDNHHNHDMLHLFHKFVWGFYHNK